MPLNIFCIFCHIYTHEIEVQIFCLHGFEKENYIFFLDFQLKIISVLVFYFFHLAMTFGIVSIVMVAIVENMTGTVLQVSCGLSPSHFFTRIKIPIKTSSICYTLCIFFIVGCFKHQWSTWRPYFRHLYTWNVFPMAIIFCKL